MLAGNGKFLLDDFFSNASPWTAGDGNSFWAFTYHRSFLSRGVWISIQTADASISWLDMMRSVLVPGAQFALFDNQGYLLATTNADELQRVADCQKQIGNDSAAEYCTMSLASVYPTEEIRDVYNSLFNSSWNDVTADPVPFTSSRLMLKGNLNLAISGTLFSKNDLRITAVWYQPWVTLQGDAKGLTGMICVLTMLSTFVLTVLGVFGVLRPLLALGASMRAVARSLKEGHGEGDAVLQPRKPNVFHEVDTIGQDFETIVVDFLGFSCANARDNRHAPKDAAKPFAVAFTDIQSSTSLWSRDPAQMSRCLHMHHELIRELIEEHRLYEVKTVGDSFMVTTTSAHDALHFALDVQTKFYRHSWGWDAADEFYRETVPECGKFVPLMLAGPVCHKLWNGLRVRVGIHYGLGDIVYDMVSKGYDYYGSVVNTASRIEAIAHGGQVVASQAVIDALPTPLDPSLGIITLLGTFPMPGVPEPPALVEVKPPALRARTFPPPRLERMDDADKVQRVSTECLSPSGTRRSFSCRPAQLLPGEVDAPADNRRLGMASVCTPLAEHVERAQVAEELARTHAMARNGVLPVEYLTQCLLALYRLLEDLLKPLAPQHHSAVVKALARGWGVPPPKSRAEFSAAGLQVVQRLSETTEVLQCLKIPARSGPYQPGSGPPGLGSECSVQSMS
eukprot:EG_transcript_3082